MVRGKNKTKNSPNSKEDLSDRTVITSIEKVSIPHDEKAYILFISGPLIGKMYLLEDEKTIIGRSPDVDITINDTRISRNHLAIHLQNGRATLEDLGSTNGTFVNGERIRRRILENGDKVHVSSETFFKFAIGDAAERMFQEEMHQMANYDAVTGVLNKHAFAKRLEEEFSYAARRNIPLSLFMIDIDLFKSVNDTFGHMAGDYALAGVAKRISEALRDEDIVARYGGEEFTVILRETDARNAFILAERIRNIIEANPFKFEKQEIPITISIGVATLDDKNFNSPKKILAKADEGLYVSKNKGRNRVTALP
jgi:diguanylate cyclase (GGDEF)-like protein